MTSERCSLVPTIKRFLPITDITSAGKVEMIDGTILEVDAVVFATGYYHSYPFLRDWEATRRDDANTRLVIAQYTVANLHLDLFYIREGAD
jgi:lysine/ornithine N-monooxygenase